MVILLSMKIYVNNGWLILVLSSDHSDLVHLLFTRNAHTMIVVLQLRIRTWCNIARIRLVNESV